MRQLSKDPRFFSLEWGWDGVGSKFAEVKSQVVDTFLEEEGKTYIVQNTWTGIPSIH